MSASTSARRPAHRKYSAGLSAWMEILVKFWLTWRCEAMPSKLCAILWGKHTLRRTNGLFPKRNPGNYTETESEPSGRNYSMIKARCLAPPHRMTSARSAGRRNGDPRFSENCHHVFRAFMQLVRWRQIWGTDARFDLLFPSTLTTATNLAVSTVAWQRNSRLFCKRGE